MAKLEWDLGKAGAFLDRIYFCPPPSQTWFPGEVPALKLACDCRKPAPGMLIQAIRDWRSTARLGGWSATQRRISRRLEAGVRQRLGADGAPPARMASMMREPDFEAL